MASISLDSVDLKERAAEISSYIHTLSDELVNLGVQEPSFEYGLPPQLRDDAMESAASRACKKLRQRLEELNSLLSQPSLVLTGELRSPLITTHAAVRLGIAEHFPPLGTTVKDLAARLGLKEVLVSPDFFVHTAASRLLAENEGVRMWILIGAEEMIPATLKTAHALLQHPDSEEPEHSGWSLCNRTDLPIFKAMAQMPDRAAVFGKAMGWHSTLAAFSLQHLVDAFPWHIASQGEALTVVDVGGGHGHASRALVESHESVQCIVEDLPDVINQGRQMLPVQERISFREHSFFDLQPIPSADLYLLRLILHDWSDKYALSIVRALVPALKPGARVVVCDRVIPDPNSTRVQDQREARDYDMYMLALQNGKERTAEEWAALFREAGSKFSLVKITQPPTSSLAVLEFRWEEC